MFGEVTSSKASSRTKPMSNGEIFWTASENDEIRERVSIILAPCK